MKLAKKQENKLVSRSQWAQIRVSEEEEIQRDQSSDLHSDNTCTRTLATTKTGCWLSWPLILAAKSRLPTSSPLRPRSGWKQAEKKVINNCHVCHDRATHEKGGTEAGGGRDANSCCCCWTTAYLRASVIDVGDMHGVWTQRVERYL